MVRTHRENVLRSLGLPLSYSPSLEELSHITKVPLVALKEVYKRGIGAWKTNIASVRVLATGKKDPTAPRSVKMSKEQWAFSRVYSFLDGGKTFHTADSDLARKYNL